MGVPAFFRWLSKKYPSIVVTAERGMSHDYHFDNLYLDMNGIIHPCTHPEHKAAPETEEEMFEAIFEYIDMLMDMVRPTKILYMAVDGVAPRAKMNQQRSRRFRAIKESQDKRREIDDTKQILRSKGVEFDENEENKAHFDSNVITPGTQFMINLSKALRDWIDKKLDVNYEEPERRDHLGNVIKPTVWPKDLIVILSDASVPGEGEHKIIDFIRKQKAQPDYNPNWSHCLCGADADLIMLGLATHELNFTILREEFVPNQPRPCEICSQYGHEMKACMGKANVPDPNVVLNQSGPGFIYIRLNVLREYFAKECEDLNLERYIDDYVFLCFFVGNDFLPHLPSLEIREGAIDRLLGIYKRIMSQHKHPKPYLTENGFVSLEKIQSIFLELGTMEDEIFQRRRTSDLRYKERQKRQKQMDHNALSSAWMQPNQILPRGQSGPQNQGVKQLASELRMETTAKQRLNAMIETDSTENKETGTTSGKRKVEASVSKSNSNDSDEDDDVQLWNSGFKERYYLLKFDCIDHKEFSARVAAEYARGLCWVLRYYYQGCVDWQWFYPFHYAPFASDFKNIKSMKIEFKRNARPFRPLEQLMSVFPAGSCQNLPPTWQKLMKESNSPIIDFYPNDFRIDLNGKKAAWQGVALLPFIDEQRLFTALEEVYDDLTGAEVERNSLGNHLVFVSRGWTEPKEELDNIISKKEKEATDCPYKKLHGMKGKLLRSERFTDQYPNAFCLEYNDPMYDIDFVFPARCLPNAKPPATVLKPEDFANNGHQRGGNYRPTIGFNQRNDQAHMSNYGHRTINAHVRANNYGNQGSNKSYRSDQQHQGSGAGRSSSYNPYAGGAYDYSQQAQPNSFYSNSYGNNPYNNQPYASNSNHYQSGSGRYNASSNAHPTSGRSYQTNQYESQNFGRGRRINTNDNQANPPPYAPRNDLYSTYQNHGRRN